MTNVLLIYPIPSIASPQKSPPLSILHVGQALNQHEDDYQVRYFDERYDDTLDMSWPDVVGVSSMTGHQLKGAIKYLKMAKANRKRTILGGIHVTMQPEQCLQEDYVDSVVLGAGEWAMPDAINGAEIAQRPLNGDHVSPVGYETLRHFQRSAKTGDTILMSSRGCPFRCGFCYTQKFFERKWESVDLIRWQQDVITLKLLAGVGKLEHGDDWIGKWSRAKEIIEFLWDNDIQYRPSMRAHQITDEVAYEMASMGIKNISVGMETGNERLLELTQKDITRDDQIGCAEALAKYGIHPLYYWIVGFPTETKAEIDETLDQADRMQSIHKGKVTQNFYAYTALPGTPLFELVDQSKLPQTMEGWSEYSLHQTTNKLASNLYHIGGLHFHKGDGDKTDRNFPGWRRAFIAPFEWLISLRWRLRWFSGFGVEKRAIEKLLEWAA